MSRVLRPTRHSIGHFGDGLSTKGKLWPSANPPKLIVTKFEWRDYVGDAYHQKIAPHIGEIHPPVLNLLDFCWFLNSSTGESVNWTDFCA